jgi:antitoxin component of RelBE/YafQ-DinJ toxin-antitoxin module
MAVKETQIIARVETETREKLEDLAAQMGWSLSELVRNLLMHSLRCGTVKRFLGGH